MGVCLGTGILGSVFTASSIPSWYAGLAKPSFNPPNWVFGPVWTTLYLLMAISIYLITDSKVEKIKIKLLLNIFWVHLILNLLWSVIFFGFRNPELAFFEIIILWGFILYLTKSFYTISKVAGLLMTPYLLWVSFAAFLNFTVWQLN